MLACTNAVMSMAPSTPFPGVRYVGGFVASGVQRRALRLVAVRGLMVMLVVVPQPLLKLYHTSMIGAHGSHGGLGMAA